jgi:hypothetical protein
MNCLRWLFIVVGLIDSNTSSDVDIDPQHVGIPHESVVLALLVE